MYILPDIYIFISISQSISKYPPSENLAGLGLWRLQRRSKLHTRIPTIPRLESCFLADLKFDQLSKNHISRIFWMTFMNSGWLEASMYVLSTSPTNWTYKQSCRNDSKCTYIYIYIVVLLANEAGHRTDSSLAWPCQSSRASLQRPAPQHPVTDERVGHHSSWYIQAAPLALGRDWG